MALLHDLPWYTTPTYSQPIRISEPIRAGSPSAPPMRRRHRKRLGPEEGDPRVRLATRATARGPGLHVRGRSGYVDVGEGTADERMSSLQHVLEGGAPALDAIRPLAEQDGREVEPADFAAAAPAPPRILCLGLNYGEHALEGGRAVPTWPDAFVRGSDRGLAPYGALGSPRLASKFDYAAAL